MHKTMTFLSIAFLLGMILISCGDSNTGDGSPTLGITSVQKTSPPPQKGTFAKGWINRGLGFLFGNPVMAQSAACPSPDAVHEFILGDGTIWITQAYLILDEIEFDQESLSPLDGPEFGPFAFDLTATDDNVPEMLKMADLKVPTGTYTGLEFTIKRIEDAPGPQPINVPNLEAFLNRIGAHLNLRPSVWIEGKIGLGVAPSFTKCTPFKFLTDQRWDVEIPFTTGVNPNTLDAVLLIDFKKAFEKAFELSGTTASLLEAEVGLSFPGSSLLDGRTKDNLGTPHARAITAALPEGFQVFTQKAGTFVIDLAVDEDAIKISNDDGKVADPIP